MRLFDFGRRRKPIAQAAALADFIDEQSAFIVQKGIFEYSRARAGHYAKILFAEASFLEMLDRSRWRAFPLGLAMVGEVTESVLDPFLREVGGPDSRLDGLSRLKSIVLAVFDRYAQPATLDPVAWLAAREKLANDLDLIGTHPPKMAKDVPERFAQAYTDLMPIHKNLRQNEGPTIRNYLKVTLCNIHDELSRRLDGRAVSVDLLARLVEAN